jgi:hypothetical protein
METPELAMLAGYGSQCRLREQEGGGGGSKTRKNLWRVWVRATE